MRGKALLHSLRLPRGGLHLVLLTFALALCWVGSTQVAQADDASDKRLEKIRAAIAESRERLLAFDRNQRGLLEALEATDESISLLSREVTLTRRKKREADAALAVVAAEANHIAARRAETGRAMSVRAVALYKAGDVGPLAILFSAWDLRELLGRMRALRMLLERDGALLDRFIAEGDALEDARLRHAAASQEQAETAAALRTQIEELRSQRESKSVALREMHKDRRREREVLVELEAAARALEETLKNLRVKPRIPRPERSWVSFGSLQGKLSPPVDAPILRSFGKVVDAQFRTKTFRKGVDFGADLGEKVVAVAPAEVRVAGWFRGYGKIVILDHDEQYFTISGHLDSVDVAVGDVVKKGERIGAVGETGSLSGPRLYFEIRRGGEALDPAGWFNK